MLRREIFTLVPLQRHPRSLKNLYKSYMSYMYKAEFHSVKGKKFISSLNQIRYRYSVVNVLNFKPLYITMSLLDMSDQGFYLPGKRHKPP